MKRKQFRLSTNTLQKNYVEAGVVPQRLIIRPLWSNNITEASEKVVTQLWPLRGHHILFPRTNFDARIC